MTVCKWLERGDRVPIGAALKLQVASRGKLKIDLRLYASDRLTA